MLQGMVNAEKYKEIILSGLLPSIESITEREQSLCVILLTFSLLYYVLEKSFNTSKSICF